MNQKTTPSIRANKAIRPSALLLALFTACAGFSAQGQTAAPATTRDFIQQAPKSWELVVSPYTYHWSDDPEHKRVGLVGLERHNPADSSFWGLALFPNSFGQNSAYGYYGHEFNAVFNQPRLFVKVSAGLIYGYKGQYKDKVPLNIGGFSPVIIPALGYRITPQDSVQAAALGTAGVMFMYTRGF